MTRQIPGQLSFFDQLPKEKPKACASCSHFFNYVSGLGEIYHGTACGKNRPFAVDKAPEDPACDDYEEVKNDR